LLLCLSLGVVGCQHYEAGAPKPYEQEMADQAEAQCKIDNMSPHPQWDAEFAADYGKPQPQPRLILPDGTKCPDVSGSYCVPPPGKLPIGDCAFLRRCLDAEVTEVHDKSVGVWIAESPPDYTIPDEKPVIDGDHLVLSDGTACPDIGGFVCTAKTNECKFLMRCKAAQTKGVHDKSVEVWQ
jgi:hypothetical protein